MLGFYTLDMIYTLTYPHIRTPKRGGDELQCPNAPKKKCTVVNPHALYFEHSDDEQPAILECLNCNEETELVAMHFCAKTTCGFHVCGDCASDQLFQCDTCGDFVCEECWYDAGDTLSEDPVQLGASSCKECNAV